MMHIAMLKRIILRLLPIWHEHVDMPEAGVSTGVKQASKPTRPFVFLTIFFTAVPRSTVIATGLACIRS